MADREVVHRGFAGLRQALPRSTRLRLWLHRRVDLAASWLADRGHPQAAMRVWQLFRMW